jgi:threonine synthase
VVLVISSCENPFLPTEQRADNLVLFQELFHGPTFAFKDVALQMLGNFFEYFLATGSNGGRLAVLGATSGDTGSAAIYGLRGKKGIDCIILFPNGRVSPIQERQMTTVPDSNIHCVAIDGTFDDCQDIVKASFNDPEFRERVKLGAVNSINWCRVLAQTTYYFWSYLRVTEKHPEVETVNYSVPTGNFGDILAGYYAKQMGLPVGKLIVATNENDILHRFFTKGQYHRHDIEESISPSMDICVSSNFERYLFHLSGNDSEALSEWMKEFETTKKLTLSGDLLKKAQSDFLSGRADTSMTLATINEYSQNYNYVLCPHSAVGVNVIHQLNEVNTATVCLATAHEGKFPAAVKRAVNLLPPPPKELAKLDSLPTRRSECPNDLKTVQAFMAKRIEERIKNEQGWLNRRNLQQTALMAALVGTAAIIAQLILKRK